MKKPLPLACLLLSLLIPQTASAGAFSHLTAQMDGLVGRGLDSYGYDYARRCTGRAQPGTLALQSWLGHHVRGVTWGIYGCRRTRSGLSMSLHAEGRAVDWHLDVRKPADRAAANRLVRAFLAPRRGRPPHCYGASHGDPGDHLELPRMEYERARRRHAAVLRLRPRGVANAGAQGPPAYRPELARRAQADELLAARGTGEVSPNPGHPSWWPGYELDANGGRGG